MNCMEARRMVTPFVKKELSSKETEAFLNHVETCEDCMDELDIYYIAYHASDLLDSGDQHEYDFEKMLREEIRTSRRGITRRRFASMVRMAVVSATEILLLISILLGANLKADTNDSDIFRRFYPRSASQGRPGENDENLPASATHTEGESNETENRSD